MTQLPVPLEDAEQIAFVQWLELQGLRFTSVPNSTFTKSWKQKRKNSLTGLRAGFPDLIILIAPGQDREGKGRLLAVEMKRIKGGVVSTDQKAWIAALNGLMSDQIESVVAHGATEAIDYVTMYLKQTSTTVF